MISIFAFIFPAIITIVGFFILFSGLMYNQNNYWILGIGAAISCYGIYVIYNQLNNRYKHLEDQKLKVEKSFDWYVTTNPQCHLDSKLSCAHCGSKAIVSTPDQRKHPKQLFSPYKAQKYNRHYCKHCASILFYTPIQAEV
ncbi:MULTISPECIES: hypothetical protein [unclassified Acinetobacter]|uniref:hypothetical protein n=1 Tax=unclassified Acinetobacter TaxID=196816 RepID=UPI0015D3C5A3|nr:MULTISPECIES: hypothetical protein [unclassified Acinetobacter]